MTDREELGGEIDLVKLGVEIWQRRLSVLIWTGVFLLLAVLYLHLATRLYTASMIVVPAQNISGVDRLGSSLGGLASLAGVSLGKQGARDPFDDYIMSVNTPEIAAVMLTRKDVAPIAFPKEWDAQTGSWREPPSIFRGMKNALFWILTGESKKWMPPDVPAMQKFIKTNVSINRDKDTGAATISFDFKDPALAEHFLNVLHRALDGAIRAKARRETAKYISYISQQLQTVTVSEQHQALAQLLSDQEKKAILAGSGLPYAADVFSEPYAPRTPSKPILAVVLLVALVLGMLFGSLYVLLSNRLKFLRLGASAVDSRFATAE